MDKATLRGIGERLREGERLRVSHGCGEGRTMLVSRAGDRVSGWCFRCAEGLYVGLDLSVKDNLLRVRTALAASADAEFEGTTKVPPGNPDFSAWPAPARLWMLRAGIDAEKAARLRASWHDGMQRVVLPLWGATGEPRSWTARSVDGRPPKYLTGHLPEGFVAEAGVPGTSWPVVVEDWLSACKLGLSGYHSVCLLGTSAKPATLLYLLRFEGVFIWLDNDLPPVHSTNYGQLRAHTLRTKLRAFGVRVANIVSDMEPKELDKEGIRGTIARFAPAPTL